MAPALPLSRLSTWEGLSCVFKLSRSLSEADKP